MIKDDRAWAVATILMEAFHNRLHQKEKVEALAARLGIEGLYPSDRPLMLWAAVGIALAQEQPEFKTRRSRGRPKLEEHQPGTDYLRAIALKQRRNSLPEDDRSRVSDSEMVARLIEEGSPLFSSKGKQGEDNFDWLRASVSRGNGDIRNAQRQVQILHAEDFRKTCNQLRLRAAGLLGALSRGQ